jgi:enoyl-CoA hydratase / 3-hydroxyacyl-CoA dehydrogenase
MFVFKAAVVGDGEAAAEIAEVIGRAGVAVVLVPGRAGVGGEGDARLGDVDLAIEAVADELEDKQAVLSELDEATPGHAILATTTSTLSISELAEVTGRPDKVVGLHFLGPPSAVRALEVVDSDYTSPETSQVAANFAQAIRKLPVRCAEAPGFVVDRILFSAAGELWRVREQTGAEPAELDRLVVEAKAAPVGAFELVQRRGRDGAVALAEHLVESYGERFAVPRSPAAVGRPTAELDPESIAERFALRALVESCLVLEEGVAAMKEIDAGMAAGAGLAPTPFTRADRLGLDVVLEALEQAQRDWGEQFEPPTILRRLVAQGRLGVAAGQGFFPYARPDAGWEERPVKLETRGAVAIAWLDRPPANSISPAVAATLEELWAAVVESGEVRAVVLASANPMLFCAGADIKAFATMDDAAGRELVARMHGLLRELERSRIATVAAVNGLAFGGGCELAMACDVRIAAESASFGQPEIGLGIIPGFGGTQRLPRLVGTSKALEMNLTGEAIGAAEAYELGLVNRLVPDHELLDSALAWARKLTQQAPLAIERIKRVSGTGDLDAGMEAERTAFAEVFASADATEGIGAFLAKRPPRFTGS